MRTAGFNCRDIGNMNQRYSNLSLQFGSDLMQSVTCHRQEVSSRQFNFSRSCCKYLGEERQPDAGACLFCGRRYGVARRPCAPSI